MSVSFAALTNAGGGTSVSDNGEADAQRFFCRLRPLEGRMKV